jgi:hypothetical protein
LQQPADGRDLVGHRLDPLAPRDEYLAGPLDRPEQDSGVELSNRVQGELERGHDPKRAAATTQGPEEVGFVVAVGPDETAVRRDELDSEHAVRREAVFAPEPRDASTDRVADDADIRRRSCQRGETVLRRSPTHLGPKHSRFAASGTCDRVDLDLSHALGLEEDRALERPDRRRVVTGALDRDPKTFAAREFDDRDDVFDGLGVRHGAGSLVDGEIPRPTRLIPLRITRNDEPSRELCRWFQKRCGHGEDVERRGYPSKGPRASGPAGVYDLTDNAPPP